MPARSTRRSRSTPPRHEAWHASPSPDVGPSEHGPTQDIGAGPHGTRVTFPIVGGSFEGDRLRGTVLPGGDDWTIKRPDGIIDLDLRVTLETDDGALIHMTFEGMRDDGAPGGPYFPPRRVSRLPWRSTPS
ncbi:MAG: DUF3237 domain-containing protein [Deltaproteobacteria bacterium]|nr:MAG: DUF3237 domain-containing protein [Deltaproteobacteria bacterium]